MSDFLPLALALLAGRLLGAFFFGGLWWTVQKGVTSENPALWFLGSLLLANRCHSGWILFCFAGPLVEARGVPPWISDRTRLRREAAHASAGRRASLDWKRRPALRLSPDDLVFWKYGFVELNSTIVTTWVLMLVMTVGAWLITRKLATEVHISRWQGLLEIIVTAIQEQIEEVGLHRPEKYLGFLGTLFLFIAVSNLCAIIPGYEPPTGSLSTTSALAISVFIAVILFGIEEQGLRGYLRSYLKPTFIMLPFNIISELSRTFALAIRLFGNIMSGTMIVAILLTITPLIFPDFMSLLGLLTGMVQAYIFSILATVYIAAATRTHEE